MKINEIKFGQIQYCEDEGGATVYSVCRVDKGEYNKYLDEMTLLGYDKAEEYSLGPCAVTVLKREADLVLCAFYESLGEARIIVEPSSEYFGFSDTPGERRCGALMTQIDLEGSQHTHVNKMKAWLL